MKKNVLVLFLLLLIRVVSLAQLDTVHWIPPLHSRDNSQVADHYVYLSTPHTTPFTVTIKDGSGNTIATPTISNSAPLAYQVGTAQIPASPLFVPIDSLNKVLKRSGLELSAPFPFYANPRVRSGSQADCLTAKGRAGAGTTFRVGGFPQVLDAGSRNFVVGIMATEPNTTVTISDYNPAILFAGNPTVSAPSLTISLNQGECYVISGYTNTPANLTGIIGALVQSDKPIVMNNGNLLGTIANNGAQDIGMDQSVPIEKIGKNYILIEGGGNADMEQPIVVAHSNNTSIYINGNASPIATINAGQYYLVPNTYYQGSGHQNMHIHTSEPAYMYQALAGSTSYATGALNFIPPYNCYMQDSIDLIPMVEKIGSTNFTGGVFVFTKQGATLTINGVVQTGAVPVLSAPWQTYKILGLTGNIKVKSTAGVAAGIFGASGAAGYAGYFSGFSDIPEPSSYTYATSTDTCHSIPINFTAHYDGAIDSLLWNFNDPASGTSDTSTVPNPEHTFSSAGDYIVSLVIYRCENDTVIDTIHAFAIPVAGFSAADVCYRDSVYFINTSQTDSLAIPLFTWNFGDGSPISNMENPVHYYAAPGAYTVRLVVKGGCSDTITQTVRVYDYPIASFSFADICQSDSAVFINTSTAPPDGTIGSLKWSFGDGTPIDSANLNPHHLFAAPGDYTIVLSAYSSNLGCADTARDTISVFPMPAANFNISDICFGDSVECTNLSAVSSGTISWSWNFGDGSALITTQHPKHKYATAGTYIITLIVTTNSGCKDTVSKNVVVHALPVAQFTAPINVCHGKIALFNEASTIPNTDTIQSWQWNFSDGSPLLNQQNVTGGHLYAATGTYNVSLIATSAFGCKDTMSKILFVRPKPVANFGTSKVCAGNNTVFSDSSTTSAGSVNVWVWNFADGSPTNITQTPSHLYANAGIHNVTLIVQNTFACADTVIKPVQVYFNPVANFTTQDVCLNDSVFFTDSSYVNISASITTYLWVFGDGTPTGNLKDPAHFYNTAGTYNVTLLSTTNQNCSDATTKTVRVFDPPATIFSVADVCLADSAIFVNTSTNPSMGTIASTLWSFGDGSLVNNTITNPHHLYSATGTYTVSLITRSSNLACADTLTDSITVFPMPIADFATADVCHQQAVSFFDSSTVANSNTIAAWNWTFGDAGTSALQNPQRTYATFGQYSVGLIVTTNNGCKDTISKDVVVHPLPTAAFNTGNACMGDTTYYSNQSTIPVNITNDGISIWNWNLGDNSALVTTTNTSHLYAAIGSYTVELTVVSEFGCADSISRTVVINPNPVVAFTADDTLGCEPLCVNFADASGISSGANAAWSWNLADGAAANGTTASHCYSNDSVFAPKLFSITLTVTSDSGCVSTLTKNNYITVYPLPVADFTVSPSTSTITDPVITITNLSTGADFWAWTFGGSMTDTSSLQNPPAQTYVDTGTYTMRLITNTQYNCTDTSYQTIIIRPDFMLYIPNAFTPNDDGVNDVFIPKGMFVTEFEMFIFDRWGNLVYKTDDMTKPWNGTVNGGKDIAQQDVYVYYVKVTDFRVTHHSFKGIVILLK